MSDGGDGDNASDSVSPADVVQVPAWVAEIEARIAADYNSSGDTTQYPILARYDDAKGDAKDLCREVRELSAIVHDLRENQGEVYVVVEDMGYDREKVRGVFLSRTEAERRAEGHANYRVDTYVNGGAVVPRFDLSARARKTMERLGVTTAQELATRTEWDVLVQRNTGQATLFELRRWLASHGLQFAGRG